MIIRRSLKNWKNTKASETDKNAMSRSTESHACDTSVVEEANASVLPALNASSMIKQIDKAIIKNRIIFT